MDVVLQGRDVGQTFCQPGHGGRRRFVRYRATGRTYATTGNYEGGVPPSVLFYVASCSYMSNGAAIAILAMARASTGRTRRVGRSGRPKAKCSKGDVLRVHEVPI